MDTLYEKHQQQPYWQISINCYLFMAKNKYDLDIKKLSESCKEDRNHYTV